MVCLCWRWYMWVKSYCWCIISASTSAINLFNVSNEISDVEADGEIAVFDFDLVLDLDCGLFSSSLLLFLLLFEFVLLLFWVRLLCVSRRLFDWFWDCWISFILLLLCNVQLLLMDHILFLFSHFILFPFMLFSCLLVSIVCLGIFAFTFTNLSLSIANFNSI